MHAIPRYQTTMIHPLDLICTNWTSYETTMFLLDVAGNYDNSPIISHATKTHSNSITKVQMCTQWNSNMFESSIMYPTSTFRLKTYFFQLKYTS